MTEKELKKLNRKQLLELLLRQTERVDKLESELAETKKQLEDRKITEMEAGSIAEAALRLNGIFEAAEKAAAQYVENVKSMGGSKKVTGMPGKKKKKK
ncbi:MAG: DNA repair protein [Clostridia bacterium]|nr:DNA repair protein [Clostridia bacterium]